MLKAWIIAMIVLAAAGPAAAQVGVVPAHVLARVRELGPSLGEAVIESARDLYAPLHPRTEPSVVMTEDLAYGPDERHRLDVFAPATRPPRPAPVVVFIHGGGFVGGHKGV